MPPDLAVSSMHYRTVGRWRVFVAIGDNRIRGIYANGAITLDLGGGSRALLMWHAEGQGDGSADEDLLTRLSSGQPVSVASTRDFVMRLAGAMETR